MMTQISIIISPPYMAVNELARLSGLKPHSVQENVQAD